MTRIFQTGTNGVDYCEFGFIRACELQSSEVQRPLTKARLQSIPNFHPQLTRPVVIRKNPDGTYRHIEGQLTIKMWIANLNPEVKIPCQIITDDSISDSRAFVEMNNTSKCNWPDKIGAFLRDEDPTAMDMLAVVHDAGYELRTHGGRRARWQFAYGCNPGLFFFFCELGAEKFKACLDMLSDLFCRPDGEDIEQDAAKDMKFWHGLKAIYERFTPMQVYMALHKENLSAADIIQRAKPKEGESCSNGGLQNRVINTMIAIVEKHNKRGRKR